MQRYIHSPKTRWLVFLFFLLPALTYPLQGAYEGITEHTCDFQHDWVAAKMVYRGVNPYRVWVDTPQQTLDYFPESDCPVPLPEIAFLNTPLTAFLLVPVQNFDWAPLHTVWILLQFIFTPLTALAFMRLIPQQSRSRYILLLPVVILFGWFGTRLILIYGQLSMILALLTVASLIMLYQERNILAGVFLGIVLCKFTIIWALPLLLLVYRRYTALAVAIGLQLLGIVLMAIATKESLIDVPLSYLDILTAWSGREGGVVSLNYWLTELGVPEVISFGLGIALALWVVAFPYRDVALSPRRELTSTGARLQANLLAIALILISLSFVYHRHYDMVLTMLVVVFWFNLTELEERTAVQERVMNLMAVATLLMLFANLLPPTLAGEFVEDAELMLDGVYTAALVITLGIVLWVVWKYHDQIGAPVPDQAG